jgi:hypothetical protein
MDCWRESDRWMEHWSWNLRGADEDAMGTGVSRWLASRIGDSRIVVDETMHFGVGFALECV